MFVSKYLHDARMIQKQADLLFALKTLKVNRITFRPRMRDLNGYLAVRTQIRSSENSDQVTLTGNVLNAVVIELVAGINWSSPDYVSTDRRD